MAYFLKSCFSRSPSRLQIYEADATSHFTDIPRHHCGTDSPNENPSKSFPVFAASKWNPSGVTLEAGKRYRIEPLENGTLLQEWEDFWITCAPEGWGGSLGKFSSEMLNGPLGVKGQGKDILRSLAALEQT
jgi:hypothetical protein